MPEESHKEQDARRRREREGRERQERERVLARERIWPAWTRTLGAMIEAEAIVRFACLACKRLYDVDVESLAVLRGRQWSLIGRNARCKASKCRAKGLFVAATGRDTTFIGLGGGELPKWLVAARPSEHEPPEGGPPDPDRPPPCPKGVDAIWWSRARTDAEREKLVREARG